MKTGALLQIGMIQARLVSGKDRYQGRRGMFGLDESPAEVTDSMFRAPVSISSNSKACAKQCR